MIARFEKYFRSGLGANQAVFNLKVQKVFLYAVNETENIISVTDRISSILPNSKYKWMLGFSIVLLSMYRGQNLENGGNNLSFLLLMTTCHTSLLEKEKLFYLFVQSNLAEYMSWKHKKFQSSHKRAHSYKYFQARRYR